MVEHTLAFRTRKPADGPVWLNDYDRSVVDLFRRMMPGPFTLHGYSTADIPAASDFTHSLIYDHDIGTVEYSNGTVWTRLQDYDATLAALAALDSSAGVLVQTGADAFAKRTLAAPAAGFSITNPAGTAGNPTFVLANDLAALEALSGTNTIYYRSGVDTWSAVTINANLGFSGGALGSALGTAATLAFDADGTFAANSDSKIATQKATKTYVDQIVAAQDAMVFKGVIDCSANPNYPAADRGHTYRVSVAGKIGGASGPNVEVGDILLCLTDGTAAGTQAAVGANWGIIQVNLDGAVIGPTSATDNGYVRYNGTTGKLIKDGAATIPVADQAGRPTSTTDNTIPRFDGTGGNLQTSGFVIDDSNHISSFGGNIKFPASQSASADVNTLDDYEEGTFTPSVTFGGASTGITYSTQTGRYTKIGRLVVATVVIAMSNKGSSTGVMKVAGLPFTAAFSNDTAAAWIANMTGVTNVTVITAAGTTTVEVYSLVATYTAATDANTTNTTNIYFTLSYTV